VKRRQPSLPLIWIVSDARNEAALDRALSALPRGSGIIFRHYHLPGAARRARWRRLARIARRRGCFAVLAGPARKARAWGADGCYGPADMLSRGPAILRLVTVHSLRELGHARRARADLVLLSPVFPTRSHPGGRTLGPLRFRLLAARAGVPVIALGGMNARRARRLGTGAWAAIDAFRAPDGRRGHQDS
jgi:thiamine-phosphate pyrophosphorylase